jgi:hypothetical protein
VEKAAQVAMAMAKGRNATFCVVVLGCDSTSYGTVGIELYIMLGDVDLG